MEADRDRSTPRCSELVLAAVSCAVSAIRLLAGRRLHLSRARLGMQAALPDGRTFTVFRESSADPSGTHGDPVTLAVWFHLRWIPPGASVMRWLFERLCILNTLLFAGFGGYLVKLWMVDPPTSDYAGLYSWASAGEAEHYARYITAILAPLSLPGSVGARVLADSTLDDYLREHPVG